MVEKNVNIIIPLYVKDIMEHENLVDSILMRRTDPKNTHFYFVLVGSRWEHDKVYSEIKAKLDKKDTVRRFELSSDQHINYSVAYNAAIDKIHNTKKYHKNIFLTDAYTYHDYNKIQKLYESISENKFILADSLIDSLQEPMSFNNVEKYSFKTQKKIREILLASEFVEEEDNMPPIPIKKDIPGILTTTHCIESLNGVEERNATRQTRSHLIEKAKLTNIAIEYLDKKYWGYYYKEVFEENEILSELDEKLISEDLEKESKRKVHINNVDIENKGTEEVYEKFDLETLDYKKEECEEALAVEDNNEEVIKESDLNDMNRKRLVVRRDSKKKDLLIIDDQTKNFVLSTYVPNVDYIVPSIFDKRSNIINSDEIYDYDDLKNTVNIKDYQEIYSLGDVKLNIEKMKPLPEKLIEFPTQVNKIDSDTITINCGARVQNLYYDRYAFIHKEYSKIVRLLISNMDYKVNLVILDTEKPIFDMQFLKDRGNVIYKDNVSTMECKELLENSKVVVSHDYSDVVWLSILNMNEVIFLSGYNNDAYSKFPNIKPLTKACPCKVKEKCSISPCLNKIEPMEVKDAICNL